MAVGSECGEVHDVKMDYRLAREMTSVPAALNIVIGCRDLDTTMRLTCEPVRREKLDLAVTTCYSLPDLRQWVGKQGFSTTWHHADEEVAFLLLRRA